MDQNVWDNVINILLLFFLFPFDLFSLLGWNWRYIQLSIPRGETLKLLLIKTGNRNWSVHLGQHLFWLKNGPFLSFSLTINERNAWLTRSGLYFLFSFDIFLLLYHLHKHHYLKIIQEDMNETDRHMRTMWMGQLEHQFSFYILQ